MDEAPVTKARLLAAVQPRFTARPVTSDLVLRASLVEHFYAHQIPALHGTSAQEFLESEVGRRDLANHLEGRLAEFRETTIPWLHYCCGLAGRRILEIGCGTGSSTVALAEQGAAVTALDIDPQVLRVAQTRCLLHGLSDVRFIAGNAESLAELSLEPFELVIFFAALEHMTTSERLRALGAAWALLPEGGFLCVLETPNRLWYHDAHTTLLNFYNWLPDDLAVAYARHVPRNEFRSSLAERPDEVEARLNLARWGRGVSFHEFELAIRPLAQLDVVSDWSGLLREMDPAYAAWWRESVEGAYEQLLARIAPNVPQGFLQPWLNLVIRK
jgi:2-polyprenyl-3-methyl-5-hydroxy-6-metoxy-1,4-benzoquinol methylase